MARTTRFKVNEGCNGYELEDTATGRTHWLGDGVDAVYRDDTHAYLAGTPELLTAWTELFNEEPEETLRAYFPDTAEEENEDESL